jgi:hypothetical protein
MSNLEDFNEQLVEVNYTFRLIADRNRNCSIHEIVEKLVQEVGLEVIQETLPVLLDAQWREENKTLPMVCKSDREVLWEATGSLWSKHPEIYRGVDLITEQEAHSLRRSKEAVYIPENKKHSLFAHIAKIYASMLDIKVVFLKSFSKALEQVKGLLEDSKAKLLDTIKSKDDSPPEFMLSFSILNNAPPKKNGMAFYCSIASSGALGIHEGSSSLK